MNLVLELIIDNLEYVSPQTLVLPMRIHVHKHVEQFAYQRHVRPGSVPLAYLENEALDSRRNLLVVDRSYLVPENSRRVLESRGQQDRVNSTAYTSSYKEIAATNRTYVDAGGRRRPLFYRHELPDGVTECTVHRIKNGNRIQVEAGVDIDISTQSVYTNHLNHYDEETGAYSVYFVQYSLQDGTGGRDILNPQPVAREAGWEDIDLSTGEMIDTYPLYTRTSNNGTWSFHFNMGGNWYIRPVAAGLLQARRPSGRDPDEPWYIRFTNGDVSGIANDQTRRYWVPEFDEQPFLPYKPLVFSTANKFLQVSRKVLVATRGTIEVDPDAGLHLDLEAYDADGVLVRAFTTDQSKADTRYSNTSIYWEAGVIDSWDSGSGMVFMNTHILRQWTVRGNYYYRADDLEYTAVNLNPLINPRVRDSMYVFYCIPGTAIGDQAIHHLLVSHDGVILECSQTAGATYPSLQLLDDDVYNPGTVIGMKYWSEIDQNTFTRLYTVGFDNTNAYLVLAEVSFADRSLVENQEYVDVRQRGEALDPDERAAAYASNYRLLQSRYGYGEDGQEIPENGVMILDVPITVLEEYGGDLQDQQVQQAVRRHMPSAGYGVVRYTYPQSVLQAESFTPGIVDLTWTWEGPGLQYVLDYSNNPEDAWTELYDVTPSRGEVSYQHQDLVSGSALYYRVSIVENEIRYPASDWVSIRVR